jgi:hypothetical protein
MTGTISVKLNEREVAQVVAALRNWLYDLEAGEDLEEAFLGHFSTHRMLDEHETEGLIHRLGFDETLGRATA